MTNVCYLFAPLVASFSTRNAIWLASGFGGRGLRFLARFRFGFFGMSTVWHGAQEFSRGSLGLTVPVPHRSIGAIVVVL